MYLENFRHLRFDATKLEKHLVDTLGYKQADIPQLLEEVQNACEKQERDNALNIAIVDNNARLVKLILASVKPSDKNALLTNQDLNMTPLGLAVKAEDDTMVGAILQSIEDPQRFETIKYKYSYQQTALHTACQIANNYALNTMFENVSSEQWLELLKIKDWYGDTCVHQAVDHGHFKTLNILMDLTLREEWHQILSIENRYRQTPLNLANELIQQNIGQKFEFMIHVILTEEWPDLQRIDNLHNVAKVRESDEILNILHTTRPEMLNQLIELNTEDDNNLLHHAAQNDCCRVFEILHNSLNKEDWYNMLHAKTIQGQMPLHIAIAAGNTEVVRKIFSLIPSADHWIDLLQVQDINGFMPIHTAALHHNDVMETIKDTIPPDEWRALLQSSKLSNIDSDYVTKERITMACNIPNIIGKCD